MNGKEENIAAYEFDPPIPLAEERKARLEASANTPDSAFDYPDIPEITGFSGFHRVASGSSFVRVDGDIPDWIKPLGDDRHLVNDILRKQRLAATASSARIAPGAAHACG